MIGKILDRVLNWCIILFTIAISIYGLRNVYDGPNILKAENHFAGGIDNSTSDFRIGFQKKYVKDTQVIQTSRHGLKDLFLGV